nr:DUF4301 family protein [uncultured Draconibacterium sp.]
MFPEKDKQQIQERGRKLETVQNQIENFKKGFPYLPIEDAASVGKGIIRLSPEDLKKRGDRYDANIADGTKALKFVPASGAASRMFKSLFQALEDFQNKPHEDVLAANRDAAQYVTELNKFAFAEELEKAIAHDRVQPSATNKLDYLLNEKGLNYGAKPKGLLKFHSYEDGARTPFEEHLVEGAKYAADNGNKASLHFTVSPEHQPGFEALLAEIKDKYEEQLGIEFDVTFSQQKPSTDTIAVDLKNEPFRNADGSLLFRPGGHGALIENLNDLDADIIFIKNIDNVVPDRLKQPTIDFKKGLAGVLLKHQEKAFYYQHELNEKHYTALSSNFLAEAANFLENTLNTKPAKNHYYTEREELYQYLKEKYNRPLRVCGMVKNEGEPGGGPFWAMNADGTISLQVVESSQIDPDSVQQQDIVQHATHFNPVDLVCAVKNYKGDKYDLTQFTDPATGFISQKSKDGKELKAQELPGLWNGAMSNWNTLFVEVPIETFNPVKTVNDLLRDQHL